MSSTYRGFLDKERCLCGSYTLVTEQTTIEIKKNPCKSYFYYEGQCIDRGDNKLVPHGNGIMWSIYDIRSIVSGNFVHGQLEGFMNVTIPGKNTEISCNYIQGKPDRSSSYMITRSSKIIVHIK
jgi:hypothetical protein